MPAGVSWKVVLAVALAGLAAPGLGASWLAVPVAGAWILAALCRAHARLRACDRDLRYYLASFGFLYLVPIAAAGTAYVLLSLYVSWFQTSSGIGWLIGLQRFLEDVSRFFSANLKLTEIEVFAVVLGVYLASCLLLAWRSRAGTRTVRALHRSVDVYGRYSGPVAAGLATLASFTFFGMQLGEPAKDLALRVKLAQEGYAELTRTAKAELTERVTVELYGKIKESFPRSYQTALTLPGQLSDKAVEVRTQASAARSEHGVRVESLDRALREDIKRGNRVAALAPELRIEARGGQRVPGELSYDQIEAARDAQGPRREGPAIELVRDGHKRVVLQIEKVVTERLVALVKPVLEAVPVLEPLAQSFVEAMDKTLQQRIGQSYDRIVAQSLREPADLARTVDREAKAIAARTDVGPLVERATPRALEQGERLRQAMSSLAEGRALLEARVAERLKSPPSGRPALPELGVLELPRLPELPRVPQYLPRPGLPGYEGPGRFTPPRPVVPRLPPPRPVVPRIPIIW